MGYIPDRQLLVQRVLVALEAESSVDSIALHVVGTLRHLYLRAVVVRNLEKARVDPAT
jgi:hypothetical protein